MINSNLINPFKILRTKIPLFILTIQLSITNIAFNECPSSDLSFWIYYPTICIICIIYESLHAYLEYKDIKNNIKRWLMILCSSIMSLISFFAVSYYIPSGKPFSCFFKYDSSIAAIIFYLSFGLVYLYSYIEHNFILKSNLKEIELIRLNENNNYLQDM